jgi:hypothetical protein
MVDAYRLKDAEMFVFKWFVTFSRKTLEKVKWYYDERLNCNILPAAPF